MPSKAQLLALAGAGYVATQTNVLGGGGGGQQNQEKPGAQDPAMIGPPGLGLAPGLGAGQGSRGAHANPGMNVTFQAPNVEASDAPQVRYTPTNPTNTGTSGTSGSDGNKQGSKGKSPNAGSSGGSVDLQQVAENTDTDIEPATQDELDDTGAAAADTPGVQSTEPDQVTRELNMQQGFTRTQTTAEMDDSELPEVDLGQSQDGNKGGNKGKSPNAGSSGGGLFDEAVDAGQNFVDDTLGWGDI